MTTTILVVRDVCSAVVGAGLLARIHGDKQVMIVNDAGRVAWETVGDQADAKTVTSDGFGCADARMLSIVTNTSAMEDHPAQWHIRIDAAANAGFDPIYWAVLSQATEVEMALIKGIREIDSRRVSIASCRSYRKLAETLAKTAAQLVTGTPATGLQSPVGAPKPVLPLKVGTSVNWSRSPSEIDRLVRACDAPGLSAWTWWEGMRVRILGARVGTLSVHPVPLGTVVSVGLDGVEVQADGGTVMVEGLSDVVGTIDPLTIPLGTLLGVDLVKAVTELRQRVTELELVVSHFARARDLL